MHYGIWSTKKDPSDQSFSSGKKDDNSAFKGSDFLFRTQPENELYHNSSQKNESKMSAKASFKGLYLLKNESFHGNRHHNMFPGREGNFLSWTFQQTWEMQFSYRTVVLSQEDRRG